MILTNYVRQAAPIAVPCILRAPMKAIGQSAVLALRAREFVAAVVRPGGTRLPVARRRTIVSAREVAPPGTTIRYSTAERARSHAVIHMLLVDFRGGTLAL